MAAQYYDPYAMYDSEDQYNYFHSTPATYDAAKKQQEDFIAWRNGQDPFKKSGVEPIPGYGYSKQYAAEAAARAFDPKTKEDLVQQQQLYADANRIKAEEDANNRRLWDQRETDIQNGWKSENQIAVEKASVAAHPDMRPEDAIRWDQRQKSFDEENAWGAAHNEPAQQREARLYQFNSVTPTTLASAAAAEASRKAMEDAYIAKHANDPLPDIPAPWKGWTNTASQNVPWDQPQSVAGPNSQVEAPPAPGTPAAAASNKSNAQASYQASIPAYSKYKTTPSAVAPSAVVSNTPAAEALSTPSISPVVSNVQPSTIPTPENPVYVPNPRSKTSYSPTTTTPSSTTGTAPTPAVQTATATQTQVNANPAPVVSSETGTQTQTNSNQTGVNGDGTVGVKWGGTYNPSYSQAAFTGGALTGPPVPAATGIQGNNSPAYNISPDPTTGTDAYGQVPGQLGMPNPYDDLMKALPGLGGLNKGVTDVLNNNLAGVLSPASQRAIQDSAAAFGVANGMGGSNATPGSLAFNRGLRDIGRASEDSQRWGASAYPGIINAVSNTQTVPAALQTDIANTNAINRAAPDPKLQKELEMQQFDKYLEYLSKGPGAGTTNASGDPSAGTVTDPNSTTPTGTTTGLVNIVKPTPTPTKTTPAGATAAEKAIIDAQNKQIEANNKAAADKYAKDKAAADAKTAADKLAADKAKRDKAIADSQAYEASVKGQVIDTSKTKDPLVEKAKAAVAASRLAYKKKTVQFDTNIGSYTPGSAAYNNVIHGRQAWDSGIAGNELADWKASGQAGAEFFPELQGQTPNLTGTGGTLLNQQQQSQIPQYNQNQYTTNPYANPYGNGVTNNGLGGVGQQPGNGNQVANNGPSGVWNPLTNAYQQTPLTAEEQNLANFIGGTGGGSGYVDPNYPQGGYPTGGYDPLQPDFLNPVYTDTGSGYFSPGFSDSGLGPLYAP